MERLAKVINMYARAKSDRYSVSNCETSMGQMKDRNVKKRSQAFEGG